MGFILLRTFVCSDGSGYEVVTFHFGDQRDISIFYLTLIRFRFFTNHYSKALKTLSFIF